MTGAEIEQRNIDLMGETLGMQYSVLFREVAALHLYWNEFLELFATNDERIARLNQAAPTFFQMLQDQQFETNMSHLARLTAARQADGSLMKVSVADYPSPVPLYKFREPRILAGLPLDHLRWTMEVLGDHDSEAECGRRHPDWNGHHVLRAQAFCSPTCKNCIWSVAGAARRQVHACRPRQEPRRITIQWKLDLILLNPPNHTSSIPVTGVNFATSL